MSLTPITFSVSCTVENCGATAVASLDALNRAGWRLIMQYNGRPTVVELTVNAISAFCLCPKCAQEA